MECTNVAVRNMFPAEVKLLIYEVSAIFCTHYRSENLLLKNKMNMSEMKMHFSHQLKGHICLRFAWNQCNIAK